MGKNTIAPIISVINMYRQARQNQCRLRQGQRTFTTGTNYHAYTDEGIRTDRTRSVRLAKTATIDLNIKRW